jgi:hypothetical protein
VSEPKRHHYIPVFYLKRWAGDDGRLCEYSRPFRVTRAKRTHPSGTAYVDGLYTVPGVSLENAQFVEKRFMQAVDDGAARAHAIMLLANSKSADLNARNKVDWARFLYSLLVRNPEQLLKIKQKADENPPALPESIREDYDLLRGPHDPPTFEEYKAWSLANPLKMAASQILPEMINSKRVITEIASMHWTTVNLPLTKHSLLTSDRRVIMTDGLGRLDAHIVVPLSPRCIFFAAKSEETRETLAAFTPNVWVKAVNHYVSAQAIKYVYGIDDSQLRFVMNRLGKMIPSSPLG